ncbi:MAG: outer membrane beta-barrel protein [Candidatus Acidiferrales bacterium]
MLRRVVVAWAMILMAMPASAQGRAKGLHRGKTIEVSGGYAFTQFNAGPGWPNMNGAYGSLALNVTSWLQIYGDGIAEFGTIPGATTRIYTNDFGPRVFLHRRFLPVTPFAEFFVGGSRLDLNVTGPGPASKYSENGFSYKTGGGFDIPLTRHWSLRAIDVDYFHTPFLQTQQNNLYVASGVVFTFGRGRHPR